MMWLHGQISLDLNYTGEARLEFFASGSEGDIIFLDDVRLTGGQCLPRGLY